MMGEVEVKMNASSDADTALDGEIAPTHNNWTERTTS